MKRARSVLSGEITRAVQVQGSPVTKGARAAIEAAGGTISDVLLVLNTDEALDAFATRAKFSLGGDVGAGEAVGAGVGACVQSIASEYVVPLL